VDFDQFSNTFENLASNGDSMKSSRKLSLNMGGRPLACAGVSLSLYPVFFNNQNNLN
jgi:hypothetical protein